jgi:phospholipid-binding lipoprotein MlaA
MRNLLVLLLASLLGACATTGDRASLDQRDPMEGFNRGVWAFNDAVDKAALKPATTAYRTVTPVPLRRGLSRVFDNLLEPFSAVNNLLQGKPQRALNNLGRFMINTTIGVGGLADHATGLGLPETHEDFGQTLAVWGAKESPYLVLPLLGPSTVRDGVGTAVRFVADPAQMAIGSELSGTGQAVYTGTRLLDGRSQAMEAGVDEALETAADPYATARSAYFQRREAQIADQAAAGDAEGDADADELLERALEEEAGEPGEAPPEELQPNQ